ncbi:MAG: leucine--tRNA ligase [Bacteroidota bacterium]
MKLEFIQIDKKWQSNWQSKGIFKTNLNDTEKKLYSLVMWPYPSGDKLHIGHWYNFAPADSWTRFKRMQGYNIFEPIGYDAFGLPAENYAIKTGVHPHDSTFKNISLIREQLKKIGAMYDFDFELNSSDESYYKWTQWIFLLLYKRGLAYRANAPVNWCPDCNTVLANEQVVDGECERCGTVVTKRDMTQWFFKITNYAQELIDSLDKLDWPSKTITMQKNWIGRSEGIEINFEIKNFDEKIKVFTTRPDTLYGATYIVLAPEHPLVNIISKKENQDEIKKYITQTTLATDIERTSLKREKTGTPSGSFAINPINGELIPIWIADYVLSTYGTGAVMAVPAHDERDFEFAIKYNLPIRKVILENGETTEQVRDVAFIGDGTMVNSAEFDGMNSQIVFDKICKKLEEKNLGKRKINYRLRDWLISRQRYWGAPIPIVYCPKCGEVPLDEKDLPLKLPYDVDFKPTGESPLARCESFMKAVCPKCGDQNAERDADTMDTFVCSSWYFLRFPDPKNNLNVFDATLINKWLPVDKYIGGAEHTVLHLLYSRFFTKVLRDAGYLNFGEPFLNLRHQGTITNQGAKMSKSKGNVVSPDDYTNEFGADTFRMFLMFMGPYEDGGDWNDKGILGIHRFLNRVYDFILKNEVKLKSAQRKNIDLNLFTPAEKKLYQKTNQTLKKVTNDIEELKFNTAISSLMELLNLLSDLSDEVSSENLHFAIENFILMLAPLAPHLSEELWEILGNKESVFTIGIWREFDKDAIVESEVVIVVQVNGKIRGKFIVATETSESELRTIALKDENVKKHIDGKSIAKEIIVKNKLVNFVVK